MEILKYNERFNEKLRKLLYGSKKQKNRPGYFARTISLFFLLILCP